MKSSTSLAKGLFLLLSTLVNAFVSAALTWPEGRYGLPKAKSGCPQANTVTWETGILFQDCEDKNPQTSKSPSYHLAGFVTSDVQREFCIKNNTVGDASKFPWPDGQYCVYQKGEACPRGMQSGWVIWDDEREVPGRNKNYRNGTLPKGTYTSNTKIFFCCSTTGNKQTPIDLPLSSPFYLIAYATSSCQTVRGARATREFIHYETEYFTLTTKNNYGGAHPCSVTRTRYGHTIYYCYYTPSYCPPLSNFANGQIHPSRCTQASRNTLNDTCLARCDPGYVPRDNGIWGARCQEDGTWNTTLVTTCIPDTTGTTPSKSPSLASATIKPQNNTTNNTLARNPNTAITQTSPSIFSTEYQSSMRSEPSAQTTSASHEGWTLLSSVLPEITTSSSEVLESGAERGSKSGLSPRTHLVAGVVGAAVVCMGVVCVCSIFYCRREKTRNNEKKRKSAMEKSKSLEELITGRMVMHRTVSEENLIYADPTNCHVEFTVKTDQNPLYESYETTPPTTLVKISENILYESVSQIPASESRCVHESAQEISYQDLL